MNELEKGTGLGASLPRIDGVAKVTGDAEYTADIALERLAHAVLVTSPVALGTVRAIHLDETRAVPGYLDALTHENTRGEIAKLAHFMKGGAGATTLVALDGPEIHHAGQILALIVAESFEAACEAADKVHLEIDAREPTATFGDDGTVSEKAGSGEAKVGDAHRAFRESDVTLIRHYETSTQHHNAIELFATTCAWDDDKLTVWEPSQFVYGTRSGIAKQLRVSQDDVRVISRFVGGGFGSKGGVTPRTALVAIAARRLGRPVKLVVTRMQGFDVCTYRAESRHEIRLGASRDGKLKALVHRGEELSSRNDSYAAAGTEMTGRLYDCPNIETSVQVVHADRATPGFMRAPAEMPYVFALEGALDELAVKLGIDPIELRRRNDGTKEPIKGVPWSSRSLMECYEVAAKEFGWSRRNPAIGSMRDGDWSLGWGCATATYPTYMAPASVEVILHADGRAELRTAAHEIGTGVMTILAQVASEKLGIPADRIQVSVGDTNLPVAPVAGGSNSTASLGLAVTEACAAVLAKERVGDQPVRATSSTRPEGTPPFGALLEKRGAALVVPSFQRKDYVAAAFGAELVEVAVHRLTCEVRVRRIVGAFAAGRIVNPRTARSQLLGGMLWGVGSALLEATEIDRASARYVNGDLAEYLVPVNADVPSVTALLVPEVDEHVNPLGIKGIGELGIVGTAAAITSAIHHATGKRLRRLPIRLEDLL